MGNTFFGSLARLWSQIKELGTELGGRINPMLRDMAEAFDAMLEKLQIGVEGIGEPKLLTAIRKSIASITKIMREGDSQSWSDSLLDALNKFKDAAWTAFKALGEMLAAVIKHGVLSGINAGIDAAMNTSEGQVDSLLNALLVANGMSPEVPDAGYVGPPKPMTLDEELADITRRYAAQLPGPGSGGGAAGDPLAAYLDQARGGWGAVSSRPASAPRGGRFTGRPESEVTAETDAQRRAREAKEQNAEYAKEFAKVFTKTADDMMDRRIEKALGDAAKPGSTVKTLDDLTKLALSYPESSLADPEKSKFTGGFSGVKEFAHSIQESLLRSDPEAKEREKENAKNVKTISERIPTIAEDLKQIAENTKNSGSPFEEG